MSTDRVPIDTEWLQASGFFDPEAIPLANGEEPPNVPPRTNGERPRTAVVTRFADVRAEPVVWRWPGRIPAGMLTVLDGDPGLGKSTLTIDIAARITRGQAMPDGTGASAPASVVLLSAEDDLARTIRPRLDAAGADASRVVTVQLRDAEGLLRDLEVRAEDLAELEQVIVDVQAALVVVDPLMAFLPGRIDSHRDQDIRRGLSEIRSVAERTGAAVLVVRHLNKSPGSNPLYRGGGSIGIIGAARSALLVTADPDDDERRILAVNKTNLALKPAAYAFQLVSVPESDHPRVRWLGPTDHTAAGLLAVPVGEEERGALAEAAALLRDVLASGPADSRAVQADMRAAGVAERTYRRARTALGVVAERSGGLGAGGRWTLRLPTDPKAANPPGLDALGNLGSLSAADDDPMADAARATGLVPS